MLLIAYEQAWYAAADVRSASYRAAVDGYYAAAEAARGPLEIAREEARFVEGGQEKYLAARDAYEATLKSAMEARYAAQDAAEALMAKVVEELRADNAGAVTSLPGFASGGLHSGGLRVVGERGWEVEATGPSRIWTQQQIGQALSGGGNAELVAEVKALRQEVAALRAANERTANNTTALPQMADHVDNFTGGGTVMYKGQRGVKFVS